MADLERYAGSIISGGVSILAGAFAAYHRLKKKIDSLEERLGSNKDGHETGIFLLLVKMDDTIKKFRREIDGWNDYPPTWAQRLFDRAREQSIHPDVRNQLEAISERLSEMEDRIDECVSNEIYREDTRKLSGDISHLKENLAEIRGILRGITSDMGFPYRR